MFSPRFLTLYLLVCSVPVDSPALCSVPFGRVQFHLLKTQQLLKQRQLAVWSAQQGAKAAAGCGGNTPLGLNQTAWPPLQKPQQHHAPAPVAAGMRAVFLTPPGAKRERNGTGVFLPRPAGAPAEPKKKSGASVVVTSCLVISCTMDSLVGVSCPDVKLIRCFWRIAGCSTVLVPARVVQALNLNLDDLGAQPCYPGGFVLDHGNHLQKCCVVLFSDNGMEN